MLHLNTLMLNLNLYNLGGVRSPHKNKGYMKKITDYLVVIFLIVLLVLLSSCSKDWDELDAYPCQDGNCNVEFWIDELVQPDVYEDENGYYHIKHWGPNYFTIKGKVDKLNEQYEINGVPLVEVRYDSDYWIWVEDIKFTVSRYSPFGLYTDSQFQVAIPIANQTLSICYAAKFYEVLNIAGYSYTDKMCDDCPYSERLMGTYSKNNYNPQQQYYLDSSMKNDTLQVYMRTTFNYDLGETEDIDKVIKIIVD